jgi:SAM-dependent methyltransferase
VFIRPWDAQEGSIDVGTFRSPYPPGSFNAALLASVFTHMLPVEARHYLGELARLLRPGGKAFLSNFLLPGKMEIRDKINGFTIPVRRFVHNPNLHFCILPEIARSTPRKAVAFRFRAILYAETALPEIRVVATHLGRRFFGPRLAHERSEIDVGRHIRLLARKVPLVINANDELSRGERIAGSLKTLTRFSEPHPGTW